MKRSIIALITCGTLLTANAADLTWQTDLKKAQAKAKQENKMVLLDFTGSDWCGWCKKFNQEVLSTPAFATYAAKNLVLVEVDFPHQKQQSAELKQANKALKGEYKVRGYPTFVVLNKDGKEIGRQSGYAPGGPQAFTAKLESFKAKG